MTDDSTTDNTDTSSDATATSSSTDVAQSTSSSSGSSSGSVNGQILDAVNQTTSIVMDSAVSQGAATAYQKVSQATAFAVQDATDYSRNVENIAMAAQGVIVAKMLEDETNIPIYTPVLATLQEMVIAASTNLATVGTTATTIATAYPSKV